MSPNLLRQHSLGTNEMMATKNICTLLNKLTLNFIIFDQIFKEYYILCKLGRFAKKYKAVVKLRILVESLIYS
jgi:hypothetical protein